MSVPNPAIVASWFLFRERARALATAGAAECSVYDELLAQLQKIDPGLYLEFSIDPNELIVTADGDRNLFPMAHAVVAGAPVLDGWKIRALKPRLGFPETVRWEGVLLRVDDLVFEPLELGGSELGLRIFVPGLDDADVEDAHNAVLRAIDHGLGELKFAEAIQSTQVQPLPVAVSAADYIPLRDLEKFIEWRHRRRPAH